MTFADHFAVRSSVRYTRVITDRLLLLGAFVPYQFSDGLKQDSSLLGWNIVFSEFFDYIRPLPSVCQIFLSILSSNSHNLVCSWFLFCFVYNLYFFHPVLLSRREGDEYATYLCNSSVFFDLVLITIGMLFLYGTISF